MSRKRWRITAQHVLDGGDRPIFQRRLALFHVTRALPVFESVANQLREVLSGRPGERRHDENKGKVAGWQHALTFSSTHGANYSFGSCFRLQVLEWYQVIAFNAMAMAMGCSMQQKHKVCMCLCSSPPFPPPTASLATHGLGVQGIGSGW